MKKLLAIILFCVSVNFYSQTGITKDSFFPGKKSFPDNYKAIISESNWQPLGHYKSTLKKIHVIDSAYAIKIRLFDDGKIYRKIKGNKIVSNSDFATTTIAYIDSSTLILENKEKKIIYRSLYRRIP